jgi:hypothetical protein
MHSYVLCTPSTQYTQFLLPYPTLSFNPRTSPHQLHPPPYSTIDTHSESVAFYHG